LPGGLSRKYERRLNLQRPYHSLISKLYWRLTNPWIIHVALRGKFPRLRRNSSGYRLIASLKDDLSKNRIVKAIAKEIKNFMK